MNEKIRELAEQANIQYVVKISDDNKDIMCVECDNGFPTAKQFEKFAELIVAECVGILEPKSRYMGEGPEVLKDKISQIKKHFGVEE